MALTIDAEGNPITGCNEGVLCRWVSGHARRIDGTVDPKDSTKLHKGGIQGVAINAGSIVSAGIDGTLNTIDPATGEITASENVGSPIIAIETARATPNVSVLITAAEDLVSIVDGKIAGKIAVGEEPSSVAISADASFAVVTLPRSKKLAFFAIAAGGALSASGDKVSVDGTPTAAAISPDGQSFAVAEGTEVVLYNTASRETTIKDFWFHTGNVTTLDFSPDGQTIVSGGKDSALKLWTLADKKAKIGSDKAHFQGVIRARFAADGETIFSVGVDNCLRAHKVTAAATGGADAE